MGYWMGEAAAMADPILTVTELRKTYGGVTAVDEVSLDVLP